MPLGLILLLLGAAALPAAWNATALVSVVAIGEHLGGGGWAGVLLLSLGVLLLGIDSWGPRPMRLRITLKERFGFARYLAAMLVTAGAIAMKLG